MNKTPLNDSLFGEANKPSHVFIERCEALIPTGALMKLWLLKGGSGGVLFQLCKCMGKFEWYGWES